MIAIRTASVRESSTAHFATWHSRSERSARALVREAPQDEPMDLVSTIAVPWSLDLAISVTGVSPVAAHRLSALAREVFLAAAYSRGPEVQPQALTSAGELAIGLDGVGGVLGVQSFVALTQTLPALLASAWMELFRHPGEAHRLRTNPELMPLAVEELLRRASPSRAVFRRAVAEVPIGDARIGDGQRVILMLAAANHDPERFPDPGRLNFLRDSIGHLGFGGGAHACSGAGLIRMAVAVATDALLRETASVELAGPAEWINGFAIRAPASLPIVLRRGPP